MPADDFVKPLKMEAPPGADLDEYPTEADPDEDALITAGYAIGVSGTLVDRNTSGDMRFTDPTTQVLLKDLNNNPGIPVYITQCGSNGNVAFGKWMEFFASVSSETSPYIFPNPSTILSLSAAIKLSSTVTFGVYINAVQIDTLLITTAKKASKINLSHNISANDELSIKIESGSCRDPLFNTSIREN